MTDGASQYLNMKATEYSKAGYPHHAAWAFTTDNHDEQRIHNELKAHGIIKQFTNTMCVLTEQGLSLILDKLPSSSEANALFEELKQAYVAAGYPERRNWAFAPNDDAEARVYNELRARGYIEQRTMVMYVLSAAGQDEIMRGI